MLRSVPIIAIGIASACAAFMNWKFALHLSSSSADRHALAIFSVALDVTKWFMLPCAGHAWSRHKPRAIAAVTIWIVATMYSLAAVTGFAAIGRDAAIATSAEQLELRAALATMRQSPRWQSSAACADATLPLSRAFCAAYREAEARMQPATGDGASQITLLVDLTGLSQETLRFVLSLFVGVSCEAISALGLFAVLSPSQSSATSPPSPARPWRPPTRLRQSAVQPVVAGHVVTGRGVPRPAPTWKCPR
jgi:hypothetical protein